LSTIEEKKWLSKNMKLIIEFLEVTKPPELPTTRDILTMLYPGQKIERKKLTSILRTLKNLRERGIVEKIPRKTVWKLRATREE